MNGYVSLGSYDDVHKKIDYKVYAPDSLQGYFKQYNSGLFSYIDVEREKIEKVMQTNDWDSRFGYRYDATFPLKGMESTMGSPSYSISEIPTNDAIVTEGFEQTNMNMKEILKQISMLESKIKQGALNKEMIANHIVSIEGFLEEEASAFNNNLEYINTVQGMLKEFRDISQQIYGILKYDVDVRDTRYTQIATKLKNFKKPVTKNYIMNL
jgi:hypothetical protein